MSANSFHIDASGRLTFEMFDVPGASYPEICRELCDALKLTPAGTLVTDFGSTIFQDYRQDSKVVGLEWDNWSGFIVVAKTPDSEQLVREIAERLLQSKWAMISNSAGH
jgi:hypothetical protein